MQGLDTGFKAGLGDKARLHVLWAEAVRALQENVDAFHVCHCVFMVTVFNPGTVRLPSLALGERNARILLNKLLYEVCVLVHVC